MYSSDTARASVLAALMLLFLWPAAQAQSVSSETDGASKLAETPPDQFGGGVLIYDQTDTTVGSGTLSQYNSGNSDFDVILADDFTVPNGLTWEIETFVAASFYSSGATTGDCERVNVIVWEEMGAGQPAEQLYNFDDLVPASDSGGPSAIGFLFVDVPTVTLTSGSYWLSMVCEGDNLDVLTAGRWNWARSDGNSGFIAQIRNDGGGFGLPSGWNTNASAIGNDRSFAFFGQESGTALVAELTVEQDGLQATSPPDATTSRVLTLRNTGTDDLAWSIPEFDAPTATATGSMPAIRFAGYPTLNAPQGGSVYARTGMDSFGYVFKDNDEPDGPAYNFTDISGTGTGLGLGDDTGVVLPLPFEFNFYGEVKTEVGVASNGYLSFGSDLSDFSPTEIPVNDTFNPNDLIAPYWDDFRPNNEDSGDVYAQDMGDGRFIVQWDNVARFADRNAGPGVLNTFQVILFEDGAIEFQYGDINATDSGQGSIGIENADASVGLQVSFAEAGYPASGRAVRIIQDLTVADFLTNADPSSGTLAPGEDVNVTVTFDATGLGIGIYNDALEIVSTGGNVTVPATLDVVGPPEIFVDPLLLEATLESGETETRPITITNTGLEDLEFSFAGYSDAAAQAVANYGPRTKVVLDKGVSGPSNGTQSFGSGGPDGFGYVWVDSNEDGGPVADFQDISGTGVEITDTDWTATGTFDPADEGFFVVDLPFAFPFYGEEQTSITVNTNGFAAFSEINANQFVNQPIPVADLPNGILAPFWDDFDLSTATGSVFYGLTDDGRFAIQFNEVSLFLAAELNSFQIILGENGTIEYQYSTLGATDLDAATVGIENLDGTDGLQIAFNETYLESDFAILIAVESRLISDVSPASGTVAPGESLTVTATVSAVDLFAGTYDDDIQIVSNDPVRPVTTVDVAVTVTGSPAFTLDPSSIGFGEVILGGSSSETVTVTNTGTDELTISSVSSDNGLFTIAGLSGTTVAPGQTATFVVTFEPEQLATASGTITVSTNAGTMTLSVAGVSAPAPVMSVTPESLDFSLAANETSSQSLTLQNDGVGVGTFNATASTSGDVTTGPVTAELEEGAGDGLTARWASPTVGESTGTRTRKTGAEITITHSESQDIVDGNSVACPTAPNSMYRVFDLEDFDIDGDFEVSNVEFGIQNIQVADPGSEVIIHKLDGEFVTGNLTEVARVSTPLAVSTAPSFLSVDIAGTFADDEVLVVEWSIPSGFALAGSNAAGQSSPTYIRATACGADEPVTFASLDFPDLHWVMNVTGETEGGGPADFVTVTPSSGSVAPASNVELDVEVDATGLAAGTYNVVIDIATNDPMNPTLTVPVTVTVAAGVANEDGALPTEFALEGSAPNPSVGQTSLRYAVPATSDVLIEVYDLMGRRVATLVDGEQTAGRKTVQWNAGSLAGGVYVYRMTAGSFASTMKMVVVR